MTTRKNTVDPQLDIHGVLNEDQTLTQADEANLLGTKTGVGSTTVTVSAFAAGISTLTGLVGMVADDAGNFLGVSGAASGGNNGTFLITEYVSATSVKIANASGVSGDGNDGAIVADVREPYSLQTNINYERTDRKHIKGTTNYYDSLPTYQRPDAIGTLIDKNLTNLVGLDSKATVCTRKFENQAVAASNLLVTITDSGNLQHADAVDRTGVPVQDGADAANLDSCYTEIIDPATGVALLVQGKASGSIDCDASSNAVTPADGETVVLDDGTNAAVTFEFDTNASVVETATLRAVDISAATDDDDVRDALITAITGAPALNIIASIGGAGIVDLLNQIGGVGGNVAITETVTDADFTVTGMSGGIATAGNRIYGYTQTGGSTEPNEVEVKFYSIAPGAPHSTANPYTWEDSQPTAIDIFFPYRERNDLMDENCHRTTLVHGIVGDGPASQGVANLNQIVGTNPGDTDLSTQLTNLTQFFPFSDLPDATPSVVEALNTLNEQIGDRDYTGGVLSDGQSITDSLQALSDAIGGSSVTRVIERLSGTVAKNSAHTIPGGNTYTLDGTDNGLNMWVYWRGQLRDPGTFAGGDDYDETSITQITPFEKIKSGEHINYFILQ